MFGFHAILLHVSAVHISHLQVGQWFIRRIKGERFLPTKSGSKVIIK